MENHMDPHLKLKIEVNPASGSDGLTPSTSEAREPPPPQQAMPPPSTDWNNQFNSPEAVSPKANGFKCVSPPFSQEDLGPFVENLLPYVRASAYNWIHLQAAKRKHIKDFDRRMDAVEENKKLAEFQLEFQKEHEDKKVKWATRLLGKLKKDIHADYKEAFVSAIMGIDSDKCIPSVPDQKGKMRRIDCLRQADKVWRLDLVTIILFKGIPLESTDGERLERCDSCTDPLCINPFHMLIGVRSLDIFMANYLKNIDTKITVAYTPAAATAAAAENKPSELNDRHVKEETAEQSIAAPHAVLGTSSSHTRVWESPIEQELLLSYDPMKACHTYFGGRNTLGQQSSSPSPYSYLANKTAIDNNYFDSLRSVLRLPPPPPPGDCYYSGNPDCQPIDISEDSNEGPPEKRIRDTSSHTSPNSSFCSTNDEVRRIVESGSRPKLVLGQSSSIWVPPGQFGRQHQQQQGGPGPSGQIREVEFRNPDGTRQTAFRSTKAVRRMTVNAGNHGDVGVVVVDERNHAPVHEFSTPAQTLANALNSLCSTPTGGEALPGRKRMHQGSDSPLDFISNNPNLLKVPGAGNSGSDVSPPHAAVSNLISRESSGYIASPTKFTTARGDTTSFSKIFQKIEERHSQQLNQPSTSSLYNSQIQPPILSSKPVDSSIKLIAPVAIKPPMMPMSGVSSPIVTPRLTPYQSEETLLKALGLAGNSNDGAFMADLAKFIDSNSRSPLLGVSAVQAPTTFPTFPVGLNQPGTSGGRNSAINIHNHFTGGMGLMIAPSITLTVPQPRIETPPIHQMPIGIGDHSPTSPESSNEGAANQAPVSDTPKDPNAPKLPTDFSQALLDQK
ncbi:unnamed protein product [Caenorhabditis brenneri]